MTKNWKVMQSAKERAENLHLLIEFEWAKPAHLRNYQHIGELVRLRRIANNQYQKQIN